MGLADGSAWEREFGVSEASKAADAALPPITPKAPALMPIPPGLSYIAPFLTGRDPMGVFPQPSRAGDVATSLPYMPTPILSPEQRADIDQQAKQNYLQVATPAKIAIHVYLDNGVVYTYEVETIASAREHAAAIVKDGYRSVSAEEPDVLTHFPPHRILKVKVKANGAPFKTNYFDETTGT